MKLLLIVGGLASDSHAHGVLHLFVAGLYRRMRWSGMACMFQPLMYRCDGTRTVLRHCQQQFLPVGMHCTSIMHVTVNLAVEMPVLCCARTGGGAILFDTVLLAAAVMLVCDKLRMHRSVIPVLLRFALGCVHDGWQIESQVIHVLLAAWQPAHWQRDKCWLLARPMLIARRHNVSH